MEVKINLDILNKN